MPERLMESERRSEMPGPASRFENAGGTGQKCSSFMVAAARFLWRMAPVAQRVRKYLPPWLALFMEASAGTFDHSRSPSYPVER